MSFTSLRPAVSSADGTSFAVTLFTVLADGTAHVLLDDRGFSSSAGPNEWNSYTKADIEKPARDCVRPDEPYDGETWDHAETAHWAALAETLHSRRDVLPSPTDLETHGIRSCSTTRSAGGSQQPNEPQR